MTVCPSLKSAALDALGKSSRLCQSMLRYVVYRIRVPTVSGPFFPQLLADCLPLLDACIFSDFWLSSAVCKTGAAALQTVDVDQLRAESGLQTFQFSLPQAAKALKREAEQRHSSFGQILYRHRLTPRMI